MTMICCKPSARCASRIWIWVWGSGMEVWCKGNSSVASDRLLWRNRLSHEVLWWDVTSGVWWYGVASNFQFKCCECNALTRCICISWQRKVCTLRWALHLAWSPSVTRRCATYSEFGDLWNLQDLSVCSSSSNEDQSFLLAATCATLHLEICLRKEVATLKVTALDDFKTVDDF